MPVSMTGVGVRCVAMSHVRMGHVCVRIGMSSGVAVCSIGMSVGVKVVFLPRGSNKMRSVIGIDPQASCLRNDIGVSSKYRRVGTFIVPGFINVVEVTRGTFLPDEACWRTCIGVNDASKVTPLLTIIIDDVEVVSFNPDASRSLVPDATCPEVGTSRNAQQSATSSEVLHACGNVVVNTKYPKTSEVYARQISDVCSTQCSKLAVVVDARLKNVDVVTNVSVKAKSSVRSRYLCRCPRAGSSPRHLCPLVSTDRDHQSRRSRIEVVSPSRKRRARSGLRYTGEICTTNIRKVDRTQRTKFPRVID